MLPDRALTAGEVQGIDRSRRKSRRRGMVQVQNDSGRSR